MTIGLEAIGKEFYSKVGVEEIFIAVGAVDFSMTENAGEAAPQTAVHGAMLGRNAVTLQAGAVIGLGQQPVVGRTVRIMALGTSAAVDGVLVNHRVFV